MVKRVLCVLLVVALAGTVLADPPTPPPPCEKPIAKAVAAALIVGFLAGWIAGQKDCPPASPYMP